ncbi:MAG: hypothetical protein WCL51_02025 [Bacteroidota bacterium]
MVCSIPNFQVCYKSLGWSLPHNSGSNKSHGLSFPDFSGSNKPTDWWHTQLHGIQQTN